MTHFAETNKNICGSQESKFILEIHWNGSFIWKFMEKKKMFKTELRFIYTAVIQIKKKNKKTKLNYDKHKRKWE